MRRKLHELLDAEAGEFRRPAQGNAFLAKQLQGHQKARAFRIGLAVQPSQGQGFLGDLHGHSTHGGKVIAPVAALKRILDSEFSTGQRRTEKAGFPSANSAA